MCVRARGRKRKKERDGERDVSKIPDLSFFIVLGCGQKRVFGAKMDRKTQDTRIKCKKYICNIYTVKPHPHILYRLAGIS